MKHEAYPPTRRSVLGLIAAAMLPAADSDLFRPGIPT
ncbi:hypothetical protein ACVWYH_005875 [Bradyrhizobium sp. GM24.11]